MSGQGLEPVNSISALTTWVLPHSSLHILPTINDVDVLRRTERHRIEATGWLAQDLLQSLSCFRAVSYGHEQPEPESPHVADYVLQLYVRASGGSRYCWGVEIYDSEGESIYTCEVARELPYPGLEASPWDHCVRQLSPMMEAMLEALPLEVRVAS